MTISHLFKVLIISALILAGCIAVQAQEMADPRRIVSMTEFSGPEAEGFHDCFWIGPVSYLSYNVAFPDEGAVYWAASFQIPEDGSHLEIEGKYPKARYMSFNAYDVLTQPTDAIADYEIEASQGANPFTSADKRGGRYKVNVYPTAAPALSERPKNALFLGDPKTRNDRLPLVFRIYVPDEDTDFTGGAGIPKVTLVMKDGTRLTGQKMCDVINSPKLGQPRKIPSVVIDKETYNKTIKGPGTKPGFPAVASVDWQRFWGGDVYIGRLFPDRKYVDMAHRKAKAGLKPKQSGFYANQHNEYIDAYINEMFGKIVVIKGKMPKTPAHGWDVASEKADIRYWSLCTNESIVTTRYSDCVYDSKVILDKDRNYTIVISKTANRPANATKECGVTWLDWGDAGDGAGDPQQGVLIMRHMLGDEFAQSIQNIPDPSNETVRAHMGPYYPESTYTSKSDFEALGCIKAN